MSILNKDFTFIDLFAGIGGFRLAMQNYSEGKAKCIFASEIDKVAAEVYEKNFNQKPLGDIRAVNPVECGFPAPDVVCGGFPCQTFSKGGNQAGFKDSRGTLFREIIRIIEQYDFKDRPKVLILENVQNLISHDSGETWKTIHHEISESGYNVVSKPIVLAPKDVNIPQLRNRAIILAVRNDIYNGEISLDFPKVRQNSLNINTILENKLSDSDIKKYSLSEYQNMVLDCWDDFMSFIPQDDRIIGFPIWSDEFGKNYNLNIYPKWKQSIVQRNRDFYVKYKKDIDKWLKKWNVREKLTPTNRKFEWQAGKHMQSVFDGIIQFRTSGIRVKRPTEAPALVAMDHRPIYGPERRFFTCKEAARLQCFPDDYKFDKNEKSAFKQLGNAVNVKVIENAFRKFIEYLDSKED